MKAGNDKNERSDRCYLMTKYFCTKTNKHDNELPQNRMAKYHPPKADIANQFDGAFFGNCVGVDFICDRAA
ncbi:hypothetical protein GCM10007415_11520 [Parapedobacter pyrenivorans]|uniref:Uncharacterized protein n=1 Tax=Parapedobacter pyrenivorans TaxID=1305674 RepID=A0A917HJ94_9SPHI|nr:hypothetical protein GCM10007415_11520 [Parapedobacter pyrenivorans]